MSLRRRSNRWAPQPGDVFMFFAPMAGKHKYHLCIRAAGRGMKAMFVLMNRGEEGAPKSKCVVIPSRFMPVPPCKSQLSEIALGLPLHIGRYHLAKASTFDSIGVTAARTIAERWKQPDIEAVYEPGVWREVLEAIELITSPDPSSGERRRLRMMAFAGRSAAEARKQPSRASSTGGSLGP